jgi:hypothetical protein
MLLKKRKRQSSEKLLGMWWLIGDVVAHGAQWNYPLAEIVLRPFHRLCDMHKIFKNIFIFYRVIPLADVNISV